MYSYNIQKSKDYVLITMIYDEVSTKRLAVVPRRHVPRVGVRGARFRGHELRTRRSTIICRSEHRPRAVTTTAPFTLRGEMYERSFKSIFQRESL